MTQEIINKVEKSGLITLDLSELIPKSEVAIIDLKDNLYEGMVLREKDFRLFVKETNWEQFSKKDVGILCSADAIIPNWAYMLVVSRLTPYARSITFGDKKMIFSELIKKSLEKISPENYEGKKVVVKGCGDLEYPEVAYTEIAKLLMPHVQTMMFGEPCSTVPIYKKKKS